ncbi:MAG: glycosyltransferase family 39 protein [Thaumarchaeota archaeon]|nr:glycosyltransferase family 39 protein [Nitrososphaerota archaeon]
MRISREGGAVLCLAVLSMASNLALAVHGTAFDFLDEQTYMGAALQLVHGQSCTIVALPFSTPCNYEHPPLVKVLEALSYYIFGWAAPGQAVGSVYEVPLGSIAQILASFLSFRFFQIVMGALSVGLVYLIALGVSGNRKLALFSSALLLLDPLFAFFSRTAYLDVPMVFFALCAYAVYFRAYRLGPLNQYWVSGSLLALSFLSKETGLIFVPPLIVYHLLFRGAAWKVRLSEALELIASCIIVIAAGLQLFDTLARAPFPTFLDNLSYMVSFSQSISCGVHCYANFLPGPWYLFLTSIYWMVDLSNNPVLLGLILLWIPFGAWALLRRGKKVGPEDRLFALAALLFFTTFTANLIIYLGGRIVWIWYLLPLIPALSLGGGYLLTRKEIPRFARVAIFVAVVAGYLWAYTVGPNLLIYD